MKSNYLFDEYNKELNKHNDEINLLENDIRRIKDKIVELSTKYKDFVKNGNEEQADTLFNEIEILEDSKAKSLKRLSTKNELLESLKMEKLRELLLNRKTLPSLYDDEKSKAMNKLDKAIAQFNIVLDEINSLNEEYAKDMHRFDSWIDRYNMKKDDVFRKEYGRIIALYIENDLISPNIIRFNENKKLEVVK
ncbi:hypothetical protein [Mammaliicoccus fleurettii]|uniref:hypothetical protein n=1 Tax=Mammaliicoccus fleurettii TaxID=150056 RepID=UPI00099424EF|nr:hypothetical protein [Mammaliicoccus fleurettii]OOV77551.1 hypothetical protein B2G86_05630 [Mammaliicoccus fleurettii]